MELKQFGANEVFICNTSNIDSMRHGRPQTVMIEQDMNLKNGAIVTLLETKETSADSKPGNILDHVHGISVVEQTEVVGKFIIIDPEINVEQYRRMDNSLAAFGDKTLEQNATHTAYELQKRDRIEYSQAHFDAATKTQLETAPQGLVATKFKVAVDAEGNIQLTQDADGALLAVSVREQRIPLMYDDKRAKLPESYYMIKLEVLK